MLNIDLAPLYRSSIGFDRLASMLENANANNHQSGYPPYNIELLGENSYRISMAVAGFAEEELDLESHANVLTVKGEKKPASEKRQYLYQGIAERSFERRFQLADYVKVTDARLENGLLHIDLLREVPEAMKPRKINISRDSQQLIEG